MHASMTRPNASSLASNVAQKLASQPKYRQNGQPYTARNFQSLAA